MGIDQTSAQVKELERFIHDFFAMLSFAKSNIRNSHDSVNAQWPDDDLRKEYIKQHAEMEEILKKIDRAIPVISKQIEEKRRQIDALNSF